MKRVYRTLQDELKGQSFMSMHKIKPEEKNTLLVIKDLDINPEQLGFSIRGDLTSCVFILPQVDFKDIKEKFYKLRLALGFMLDPSIYSDEQTKLYKAYISRLKYELLSLAKLFCIDEISNFVEIKKEDDIASQIKKLKDSAVYKFLFYKVLFAEAHEIKECLKASYSRLSVKDKDRLLAIACMTRDSFIVELFLDYGFKFSCTKYKGYIKGHRDIFTIYYNVNNTAYDKLYALSVLDKFNISSKEEARYFLLADKYQDAILSNKINDDIADGFNILNLNTAHMRFLNFKLLYERDAILCLDKLLLKALTNGFTEIALYLLEKDENYLNYVKQGLIISISHKYIRENILDFIFNRYESLDNIITFLDFCKRHICELYVNEKALIPYLKDYKRSDIERLLSIMDYCNFEKLNVIKFLQDLIKYNSEVLEIFLNKKFVNTNLRCQKLLDLAIECENQNAKLILMDLKNQFAPKKKTKKLKL